MLEEGDRVRINAPASRKFNGRTGVITHKGSKRWNVRFDDDPDTILALHPSCLEPYDEDTEKVFIPGKCADCGMSHRVVCHWGEDIPEAELKAHKFNPDPEEGPQGEFISGCLK